MMVSLWLNLDENLAKPRLAAYCDGGECLKPDLSSLTSLRLPGFSLSFKVHC